MKIRYNCISFLFVDYAAVEHEFEQTPGDSEGRSRADAVGPSLARSGKGRPGPLEALLTSSQQLCDNDPQWLIISMK